METVRLIDTTQRAFVDSIDQDQNAQSNLASTMSYNEILENKSKITS